jgi:hypothetical protein
MNTVTKFTTTICIFLFTWHSGYNQQNSGAKNFTGSYAGIDWTSISSFKGFTYERLVHGKASLEIGVRASYTVPYRYGNFQLLYGSFSPPVSEIKLGVYGYSFPNKAKINTGFFITAGAGIESSFWKVDKNKYSSLSPSGELGFGWKWPIGKNIVLRWTNTLGFATIRPYAGGDMTTTSTIAIGF